jgi:hypothetical protein
MKNEYSILAHTDDTATVIDANGNAVYFATSYDIALRWVTAKRVGMIIAQQEQQPQEGSDARNVRVHVVNALGYQVQRSLETVPGLHKTIAAAAKAYARNYVSLAPGGKVYVHNDSYTETLAIEEIPHAQVVAQPEQQPQEGSDIAELADQFKKAVLFQAVAAQVTRSRYFHRLNEIDLRIAQITLDLHNENDGERAGHLRQEFNALYAEREEILPFG